MKYNLFCAHPWHGVEPMSSKEFVTAYIEIAQNNNIKFELDKDSGLLKIDRPQKYSNVCPAHYGFIPRTYCGNQIAQLAKEEYPFVLYGDGDPLDILVLSTSHLPQAGILLSARVIGGITIIDKEEADDKIIAVLKDDTLYGAFEEITDIPSAELAKIEHYFLTYKSLPGKSNPILLGTVYNKSTAELKIKAAMDDYQTLISNRS